MAPVQSRGTQVPLWKCAGRCRAGVQQGLCPSSPAVRTLKGFELVWVGAPSQRPAAAHPLS